VYASDVSAACGSGVALGDGFTSSALLPGDGLVAGDAASSVLLVSGSGDGDVLGDPRSENAKIAPAMMRITMIVETVRGEFRSRSNAPPVFWSSAIFLTSLHVMDLFPPSSMVGACEKQQMRTTYRTVIRGRNEITFFPYTSAAS